MNTDHDWRDVLLKAASIVEEEGRWTQKTEFRSARNGQPMHDWGTIMRRADEVRVCALGAIGLADRLLGGPSRAVEAVRRMEDHLGVHPVVWNDWRDRTADEVADALRTAAE